MRVADVMTEDVRTIDPHVLLSQARTIMRGQSVDHLAVVERGELVGIVSAHDLDNGERRPDGGDLTVADVMTHPVATVTPATAIKRAANIMRGRSIGSLVVMTGGKIVGIVTVSDLLDLIGRGLDRPVARGKRWTLKHRVPHVKRQRPTGMW